VVVSAGVVGRTCLVSLDARQEIATPFQQLKRVTLQRADTFRGEPRLPSLPHCLNLNNRERERVLINTPFAPKDNPINDENPFHIAAMADIRNFFGSKGGAPPPKPAAKKEEKKPRASAFP
jgi:hypothetical protein